MACLLVFTENLLFAGFWIRLWFSLVWKIYVQFWPAWCAIDFFQKHPLEYFLHMKACNFMKKRLQHRRFPLNIAKFKKSFIEHLRWLLLSFFYRLKIFFDSFLFYPVCPNNLLEARKVVITFAAMIFFVTFSWDIFTDFIHSEFGMLL